MTAWVKKETNHDPALLLRSKDNPLFLGRLNLGEGGAGMYANTPEYAEVGGQKFNTRHLESMVLDSPDQVHKAVDNFYQKLPGEWGDYGVCHQGVVATAESFGLDKAKFAQEINGLWLTRLKFGRTLKRDFEEPIESASIRLRRRQVKAPRCGLLRRRFCRESCGRARSLPLASSPASFECGPETLLQLTMAAQEARRCRHCQPHY